MDTKSSVVVTLQKPEGTPIGDIVITEQDTVETMFTHKIPERLGSRLGANMEFGLKYFVSQSQKPISFTAHHLSQTAIKFLVVKYFVMEKIDDNNRCLFDVYGRVLGDEKTAQIIKNNNILLWN